MRCKPSTTTITLLAIGTLFTIFGIVWYACPELKHLAHQLFTQNTLIIKTKKSILYPLWVATPKTSKVFFSIRLFNVTNPEEIISGVEKPNLQEIGPFVYNVISKKENVIIDGSTAFYNNEIKFMYNAKVTQKYQLNAHKQMIKEMKKQQKIQIGNQKFRNKYPSSKYRHSIQKFDAEIIMKNYTLDSVLTVLNVPLIVISMISDESFILRKSNLIRPFLKSTGLFIEKTVQEILWGYEDENLNNLENLRQKYPRSIGKVLKDRIDPVFGMLIGQNDSTSPGQIEIDLGINNFKLANQIKTINNDKQLNYWYSEDANRIQGTDGGQMMTHPMVEPSENLTMFMNEIYRCVNMTHEGSDKKIHGIKTHKYHFEPEIFNYTFPKNLGYCKDQLVKNCPPDGLIDLSSAVPMNASVFVSKPHFLHSDKEQLLDKVGGLSPNESIHDTHAFVEPTTGFILAISRRYQYSFLVKRSNLVRNMMKLEKELYFPVLWFEITAKMSGKDAVFWKSTIGIINFAMSGLPTVILTIGVLMIIGSLICKLRDDERQECEYDAFDDCDGNSSFNSQVISGDIRESISSRNSEVVIFDQNRTTEGDDDVFEHSYDLAENNENITCENRVERNQKNPDTESEKGEQVKKKMNGVNDNNPIDLSLVNSHSE